MKTLSMAAFAVALMASVPVVSAYAYPDAETQDQLDWQVVVDQANANRLGLQTQKQGDVAAVKASQATDATQAPAAAGKSASEIVKSHYNFIQDYWEDRS